MRVHVFANALTADNAILVLLDYAAAAGWAVLDYRTYLVETTSDAATIANALTGEYGIVVSLDSTGPNVYHVVATIRDRSI
jgi:hypothetical protein